MYVGRRAGLASNRGNSTGLSLHSVASLPHAAMPHTLSRNQLTASRVVSLPQALALPRVLRHAMISIYHDVGAAFLQFSRCQKVEDARRQHSSETCLGRHKMESQSLLE